jgi:hypothetical protein
MPEPNFILICTICRREKSDKTGKRYCICEKEDVFEEPERPRGNPFEGEDIMEFLMGFGRKK